MRKKTLQKLKRMENENLRPLRYLETTTKTQDEVKSGFLLNIIIR